MIWRVFFRKIFFCGFFLYLCFFIPSYPLTATKIFSEKREADAADAFCGGDEEGHDVAQEEDQTQEEEEQQEVECAVSVAAGFAVVTGVSRRCGGGVSGRCGHGWRRRTGLGGRGYGGRDRC